MRLSSKYKPYVERILSKRGVRYVLLSGGRGSGKTYVSFQLLAKRVRLVSGEVGVVARYTYTGARKMMNDIADTIPDGVVTKSQIIYGNNRYYIDGIKTSSPSKLKSINRMSFLMIDEAQDIKSYQEFSIPDKSIRGGIDKLTVLIFNPTHSRHWIYSSFGNNIEYEQVEYNNTTYNIPIVKDKEVLHIHTTFLNLPKNTLGYYDMVTQAEVAYRFNQELFANEFIGVPLDYSGNIILRFKRCKEEDIDYSLPTLYGLDIGFHDATALVKVWVDKGGGRVFAKVLLYITHATANQLFEILKNYQDAPIISDVSNKQLTEELRLAGCRIFYKNQRVSLIEQLRKLSDYIIYTPDNQLLNELVGYCYGEKGIVNNNGDHAIDAVRYAAFDLI